MSKITRQFFIFFHNPGGGSDHYGKFHKKNIFLIETFPKKKERKRSSFTTLHFKIILIFKYVLFPIIFMFTNNFLNKILAKSVQQY